MKILKAFKGEVFNGINVNSYTKEDLEFSQSHLRILSGLYGILRPLDLIKPYRLEMGTKLITERGKNLYEFWGNKIADSLMKTLKSTGDQTIVNLASDEYFKSVAKHLAAADIYTPAFLDYKNGKYKFLTVYGKRARGMMARFIIKNRITDIERLKLFDEDGYYYNDEMSNKNHFVFTRG